MGDTNIEIDTDAVAEFCRRNGIHKLSLFGSVLRDDFHEGSDVDLLVEFEPGRTPGWEIVAMEQELSRLLGRKADLRTAEDINRRFREKVVTEAEALFVS